MAREGSADLFFCLVGLQDLVLALCNTLRCGDALHCITPYKTAIYHPTGFPIEQRYSSCKYPLENKIFSLKYPMTQRYSSSYGPEELRHWFYMTAAFIRQNELGAGVFVRQGFGKIGWGMA